MTGEEIDAIVGGYHGDAFRILGPHGIRKKNSKPRWEVRAFLPQAETAAVQAGSHRYPMVKLHHEGFFCVAIEGEQQPYVLVARTWDGREVEIDDPYSFGPLISASDLYLYTE